MSSSKKKTTTQRIFTVLKFVVTFSGLAYLFNKIPISNVLENWQKETCPWMAFILVLTIISMAIQANRWRGLLLNDGKKNKIQNVLFLHCFRLFFQQFTP